MERHDRVRMPGTSAGAVRVASSLLLVGLAAATQTAATAAPPRTQTVTKAYTPANTFVTDAVAERTAVRFATPPWARSAVLTVSDTSMAIVYWAHWTGSDTATLNCSIANGSFTDPPTRQVLRRIGRGDLLVAPAPVDGITTHATTTFRTCPYPYVAAPTTGTISVTFSARDLTARRRS